MVLRCQNCKTKVARFPIKDANGKWIVKNLFKMDMMSIILLVVVIFLATTYKADTETCRYIVTHPLTYCEESNACKVIEEQRSINPYRQIDLDEIPVFNVSVSG